MDIFNNLPIGVRIPITLVAPSALLAAAAVGGVAVGLLAVEAAAALGLCRPAIIVLARRGSCRGCKGTGLGDVWLNLLSGQLRNTIPRSEGSRRFVCRLTIGLRCSLRQGGPQSGVSGLDELAVFGGGVLLGARLLLLLAEHGAGRATGRLPESF